MRKRRRSDKWLRVIKLHIRRGKYLEHVSVIRVGEEVHHINFVVEIHEDRGHHIDIIFTYGYIYHLFEEGGMLVCSGIYY